MPYVIDEYNMDPYPLMKPVAIPVSPEPTPIAEPSPTPTSSPEPNKSPEPTFTPEPTATPTEEPQQPEQDLTAGAILAATSIAVFLGLLFYFIKKRKR